MASYVKFQDFAEQLGKALHHLHAAGDTLKVCLTNTAPSASASVVYSEIVEISAGNGYGTGGSDAQNDYSETGGTVTMTCVDIVWTASGGSIGPLRYAVMYNDTNAAKGLVAYWDYGSSITVNTGETFTVDFGSSMLTIA